MNDLFPQNLFGKNQLLSTDVLVATRMVVAAIENTSALFKILLGDLGMSLHQLSLEAI